MEVIDSILGLLLRPFVAWTLLASIIGQVVKTQVFTRARAHWAGSRIQWFWWWGRKTMPLHPMAIGMVIGWMWPGEVEPGYIGGTVQAALYFGLAGGLSVWAFEVLKGLAKKRGVTLGKLPGQSDRPCK